MVLVLPEGLDPAVISQVGFDDGSVCFVGQAVMVEVVPAGVAAALCRVAPVGPLLQVLLIHLQVAVTVAGAVDAAGQQVGQFVAQGGEVGLLLAGQLLGRVAGQQVELFAVELEFGGVGAFVYFVELLGVDQSLGGAVQAAQADQFEVFVTQRALVLGEQYRGGLVLAFQVGV